MSEVQSSAPSASNPIPPSVLDFPIWKDCPFQSLVPAGIEIRSGDRDGQRVLIFWWPEQQLHIDMDRETVNLDEPLSFLTPVIGNLVSAAWDKEFPDLFIPMIRAQAEAAVSGKPLPDKFIQAKQRLDDLNSLVPRAALSSSPSPV